MVRCRNDIDFPSPASSEQIIPGDNPVLDHQPDENPDLEGISAKQIAQCSKETSV